MIYDGNTFDCREDQFTQIISIEKILLYLTRMTKNMYGIMGIADDTCMEWTNRDRDMDHTIIYDHTSYLLVKFLRLHGITELKG
jgi:hypothetical protein